MRHRNSRVGTWLMVGGCLTWSCQSVLDISDPVPREEEQGGEAGDGVAGASGASEGGQAPSSGGDGSIDKGGHGGDSDSGGEGGITPSGGQSGEGNLDCSFGEIRCGGPNKKTPEVCDQTGTWGMNAAQTEGSDCEFGCVDGKCSQCLENERDCAGEFGKEPRRCEGGAWIKEPVCPSHCSGGSCRNPPSCSGGLSCANSTSCCSALAIPGGEFSRDYDGVEFTDTSFPADVSSFLLDEFEVTVGRFRQFVNVYPDIGLEPGDGKAPHIMDDNGWSDSLEVPATLEELKVQLNCDGATWSDDTTQSVEERPINCVSAAVAYAFCVWDGGRLPTEAEWNYAAAGGEQQRVYPWSDPPQDPTINPDRALYKQSAGPPLPVGSKPLGNARWGHADLAGNLREWVLDTYVDPYEHNECHDCLQTDSTGLRPTRGGSFLTSKEGLSVAFRGESDGLANGAVGFRCAYDLPSTK